MHKSYAINQIARVFSGRKIQWNDQEVSMAIKRPRLLQIQPLLLYIFTNIVPVKVDGYYLLNLLDDNSGRKKRKINGYYLLNLLGEVAAGIVPVNLHGLLDSIGPAGIIPEVSCSPEDESKSKNRESAATAKTEV
ncbi:histone-lysine N-methyltransferase ATX4-like [Pyrus ussuriensis x Pyrus communis]|uniref:Histone-lysine N-methyltransferase ATX4-like n=1 Tax=Pyrus ussuriensis x Pyrus communis TaxID=2448454 RepID=A0A5N5EUR1_9ROSA|nr:histone-lysine N-methyltransferase ATX4-like [Pyrus ussuriensis x Pyrus communis]